MIHKHSKGGFYITESEATHSETGEELVIYRSLENDKVWARPKPMFQERFTPVPVQGTHVIAELEASFEKLDDIELIQRAMLKAASGMNVLNTFFHKFEPYGVTGMVVISESHLSIHTWPEVGYAAVDMFTCGTKDPVKALGEFCLELGATQKNMKCFVRSKDAVFHR